MTADTGIRYEQIVRDLLTRQVIAAAWDEAIRVDKKNEFLTIRMVVKILNAFALILEFQRPPITQVLGQVASQLAPIPGIIPLLRPDSAATWNRYHRDTEIYI